MKNNIGELVSSQLTEEFTRSKRISEMNSDEERYDQGRAMSSAFNRGLNQGGVSISIDNNHLFITICIYEMGGYKNCDIYTSDYLDGEWSPLKNLGHNVNRQNAWDSQPYLQMVKRSILRVSENGILVFHMNFKLLIFTDL